MVQQRENKYLKSALLSWPHLNNQQTAQFHKTSSEKCYKIVMSLKNLRGPIPINRPRNCQLLRSAELCQVGALGVLVRSPIQQQ